MRAFIAVVGLAVLAGCATSSSADCDRACKLDVARAIANGGAIPAGARITENGADISADQQWLRGAAKIDLHAEYASDSGDAVIIAGTGAGRDGKPALFGLRLKLAGGVAKEAELVVTHEGEAGIFPATLPMPHDPLFSAIVPTEKRTPPAKMIAAAAAYFDGIEKHDGRDVPTVDICNRIENGYQTTHSDRYVGGGCNSLEAFAYIPEVRQRRFPVVDEERGVVVGIVAFWIPGGDYERIVNGQKTMRHYDPRSLLLMEAFKVVDGRIEKIEATMRNVPLGTKTGW